VFRDSDGTPLVELEHFAETSEVVNGIVVQVRETQGQELRDGSLLTNQMLMSRRPIAMCVCAECRSPSFRMFRREEPSAGILLMRNARRCHRCHRTLCMRHSIQCGDGKWRCRSCTRGHRFARFLHSLFFTSRSG